MRVGLFFGSFNPVHVGHLMIANTVLENSDLNKVWFVVSPQNPFKEKSTLAHEFDRFDMIKLSIAGMEDRFDICDIEFHMPRPSYTIDTLTYLNERFPSYEFTLIMGADNLNGFRKWKNHQAILDYYKIIVYPRPEAQQRSSLLKHKNVTLVKSPLIDISATYIRMQLKCRKRITFMVLPEVERFIDEKGLYLH